MSDPFLKIDYQSHPAFRALGAPPSPEIPECDKLFREIDAVFDGYLEEIRRGLSPDLDHLMNAEIQPRVDRLRRISWEAMKDGDFYRPVADRAFGELPGILRHELFVRTKQLKRKPVSRDKAAARVARQLAEEGLSLHRIDPVVIRAIWDDLTSYRQQLERRRAEKPAGMASCVIPLPLKGKYFSAVKAELKRKGILNGVLMHTGYRMDLDYCAFQLSHPYEDWYRGCYTDVGIVTPKTTYMHLDVDFALIKVIIYLSDVKREPELAPFSLVKQQTFLHGSYAQQSFFKRLDQCAVGPIEADPETQGSYYRPRFKLPKYRREFLKLPTSFQGTSHFGDDLIDGSELSEHLLAGETVVTSDVANCFAFVGGQRIHRGGMVSQGERWSLQVGFRLREPGWRASVCRWRQKVSLHSPEPVKNLVRRMKALAR